MLHLKPGMSKCSINSDSNPVELELSAEDVVGNEVQVEEEVKGAIDTVLDALGQVWDAIAEVLSEVAEAVKDAVDVIKTFIINQIEEIFAGVFDPILQRIRSWFMNIADVLEKHYTRFTNESKEFSSQQAAKEIVGAFFGDMLPLIMGVVYASMAAITLANVLSGGSLSAAGFIIPLISGIIITAIASNLEGVEGGVSGLMDVGFDGIFEFIKTEILGYDSSQQSNSAQTIFSSDDIPEFLSFWGSIIAWITGLSSAWLGFSYGMLKGSISSITSGVKSAARGVGLALFSATFSFGLYLWATNFRPELKDVMAIGGTFFAIFGAYLSYKGVRRTPLRSVKVAGGIGILFAVTSIISTVGIVLEE